MLGPYYLSHCQSVARGCHFLSAQSSWPAVPEIGQLGCIDIFLAWILLTSNIKLTLICHLTYLRLAGRQKYCRAAIYWPSLTLRCSCQVSAGNIVTIFNLQSIDLTSDLAQGRSSFILLLNSVDLPSEDLVLGRSPEILLYIQSAIHCPAVLPYPWQVTSVIF